MHVSGPHQQNQKLRYNNKYVQWSTCLDEMKEVRTGNVWHSSPQRVQGVVGMSVHMRYKLF